MTTDPPSQTLTVGDVRRKHDRRHLVVLCGETTQTIELATDAELVFGRTRDADVLVADRTLSRRHLRISVGRTVRVTDLDSHNGTRLRGQSLAPGAPVELLSGDVIEAGQTTIVFRDESRGSDQSTDGAWAQAQALGRRVHKTSLNVMLLGPAGSGRRTLGLDILGEGAGVIDGRSLDADVLRALPEDPRPLLLLHCDEIPVARQASLARIVADRTARVVSTATRDPGVLAASLDFYLPLHRALSGVVIRLPSLADCKDELGAIADHVLRTYTHRVGSTGVPRLSPEALKLLTQRSWPGEFRALVQCLEATAMSLRGPTIKPADLRLPHEAVDVGDPDTVERQRILDALAACGGNQTKAAKLLKISRRTLVSRLDRYGIARPRKRPAAKKP
ncbi:MAG: helix-turn-helix domain-containing protein [Myxococcota bacterium]